MKGKLIIVAGLVLLFSCSNESELDICPCIKAGEELSEFSSKMTGKAELGEVTQDDQKKMKQLRDAKDKVCKPFETMGGPEMLELKKKCKEGK